jgi:hypothetical protein
VKLKSIIPEAVSVDEPFVSYQTSDVAYWHDSDISNQTRLAAPPPSIRARQSPDRELDHVPGSSAQLSMAVM